MENRANLYNPIFASTQGPAPLVIRAVVSNNNVYIGGGVPQTSLTAEDYVLVSSLPKEIQERIKVAIQAIVSGM
jgi:hypothetical protein